MMKEKFLKMVFKVYSKIGVCRNCGHPVGKDKDKNLVHSETDIEIRTRSLVPLCGTKIKDVKIKGKYPICGCYKPRIKGKWLCSQKSVKQWRMFLKDEMPSM
jgi:hypothetical protein